MNKKKLSQIKRGHTSKKAKVVEEEMNRVIDRLVSPALLLLLHQKNSHGYELIEKLSELALPADASFVYRYLRHLEEAGLLRSAWDTNGSGPAKRVYKLTADGEDLLHAWFASLKKEKSVFEKLFFKYEAQTAKKMGCNPCATGDPCCEPPDGEPMLKKSATEKKVKIPIVSGDAKGRPKSSSCGC